MVRRIHDFDPPDRFLAGAIGRPGARAFYLQANRGPETISVALEKVQVAVLAERLLALLAEVERRHEMSEADPGTDLAPIERPLTRGSVLDDPGAQLVELRPGVAPADPRASGGDPAAGGELEEPIDPAFRAGTLSLAWDGSLPEVVIEAMAMSDDEVEESGLGETLDRPTREWADDDPLGPDLLRVHLSAETAAAFARAAQGLVAAGRPPCPLCGQPLDPQGHLCPRRNGHTPRLN